jgi:hypothetical protein
MKVRDLIIQLLAMPMTADAAIDLGEEFCDFTLEPATGTIEMSLVALKPEPDPPHIAEIVAKYDSMADAAPDMLAALKEISRNSAISEAWLAPVRAAIARAEGGSDAG